MKQRKSVSEKKQRKIYIKTSSQENQTKEFCSNQIKTAKYNIFTFLPLALFYQFMNGFNLFFLFNAILMSIPNISSLSPSSAIIPFVVVVCISLIREALEDVRKHKYDRDANNSLSIIYKDSQFIETKWAEMQVGQIVKVKKNEFLPVDLLVIKSSMENGFCYLETTNLDGETALKPREALSKTHEEIIDESSINVLYEQCLIEVDQPNMDIYNIEGTGFLNKNNNDDKAYFDIKNVLLRGGKLKNVDYVYGIIIYTGRETKLMQNINHSSKKTSSIAHKLNLIVLFIVIVVFSICIICTIIGGVFRTLYLPDYTKGFLRGDYIFYYDPSKETNDTVLEIVRIFTGNFSIFSTLIPMSIIIVFAIVNTYQTIVLEFFDAELQKDEGDKVQCFSMSLQEEMGMIKYIFTDKTGTLTCNEMEFKACSIFNLLFDDDKDKVEMDDMMIENNTTVQPTITCSGVTGTRTHTSKFSKTFRKENITEKLQQNIPIMLSNYVNCPFKGQECAIKEFLLNLSLNHNVLTEYDAQKNMLIFQGANPDEVTLVSAAAELGFRFIERNKQSIKLKISIEGNELETSFELLHMFEFTSSRQKSSLIIRDIETNEIKIYIKGSDRKIFESIDAFSRENILPQTKEHMDSFARRGLRTLCYSYKIIDHIFYDEWKRRYDDIKYKCINDKSLLFQLEEVISEIESNTVLLGISALEDKLQAGVKEDLQAFIDAGINVWMITGDKMDTAESIGHSCKLFTEDTEVFKIKESTQVNDVIKRMKEIKSDMQVMQRELKEIAEMDDIQTIIRSKTLTKPKVLDIKNNEILTLNNNGISSPIKEKRIDTEEIELDNHHDNPSNSDDICLDVKNVCSKSLVHINDLKQSIIVDDMKKDIIFKSVIDNNYMINEELNADYHRAQKHKDSIHDASILKFMADKEFLVNSHNHYDNMTIIQGKVLKESAISNSNNSKKDNQNELNNHYEHHQHYPLPHNNDKNQNPKLNHNIGVPTNQKRFQKYFTQCKQELEKYQAMIEKRNLKNKLKFWRTKSRLMQSESKSFDLKMNFGLIIEGQAISQCIIEGEAGDLFWELIKESRSLICCRCSPVQKAQVVKFIKEKSNQLTLAIGDGGNDVNMIKTAHVGIGLFGKEGYQAAYNSDYAISQFKYLKRLLFYNGHFALERNTYFLYFYLFKNVLFSLPQFCLSCSNMFSGANLYDNWYYTGFNSFLTVIPVAARAVSEEDFDPDFKGYPIQKHLLQYLLPDIYSEYRDKEPFNLIKFLFIFLSAGLFTLPCYLIPAYSFDYGIRNIRGSTFSNWDSSIATFFSVVLVHFFIICSDTQYYNWLVFSLYGIQILINILFIIIYEKCDYGIGISGDLFVIFKSLHFWIVLILSCSICCVPFFIYRRFEQLFGGMIVDRIKFSKCEDYYVEKFYEKKIAIMTRATRSVAKFRKIYKMNNEEEFDNLADQQMKKIVDEFKQKKKSKRESKRSIVKYDK